MQPTGDFISRQTLHAALDEVSIRLRSMEASQEPEAFGLRTAHEVFAEALKIIGDGEVERLQVGRVTIQIQPTPRPKGCFRWWKWCICIPWLIGAAE